MVSSLLMVALAGLAVVVHGAGFDWQWHTGRATHYGGPGDAWSIHNGHCGYGYLDPNVGTGWDIAAPSDQNWDFDASTSNCGLCYEVGCQAMSFNDFYGNWLDRSSVCYDQSASVIVMVTDECPCYYPPNAYSNKRWCCGDMQHFDISIWAFEKLADIKWGVMGVRYRRVPCDYAPEKRATLPNGVSPAQDYQSPPWNWDSSKDKRWTVLGSSGASASASTSASATDNSASSGSATASSSVTVSHGDSSGQSVGQQSSVINAYYGGFMQGWSDSGSWGISKWGRDSSWSFDGQQAYCATLSGYGGIQYDGWSGVFSSKQTIELYARQNNGGTPDVSVKLTSASGSCKTVRLQDMKAMDQTSNWVRFQVQLSAFDWRQSGGGDGSTFAGCSDSVNDWSVSTLLITNNWGGNQDLCIDQVKIF